MSTKFSGFSAVTSLEYIVGLAGGDNAIVTLSQLKASLNLAKGDVGLGNVDNTSDATKNAAAATLTSKTISGASNTLSNIGNSALTNSSVTISGHSLSLGGTLNLAQADVSGLTTTSAPTFSNVVVTHSSLTYASTTTVDFSGDGFKTETLTGDVTFASSNLAAGRQVTIRIIGDSSDRTVTKASGWKVAGLSSPATLPSGKTAVLTLTSFSTDDANVCGAYAQLD